MELCNKESVGESSQILCLTWVKREAAQSVPDKIQLTKDELKEALNKKKKHTSCDSTDYQNGLTVKQKHEDNFDDLKEFDMDNYDNEEDDKIDSSLSNLFVFANNQDDPYITRKEETVQSDDEQEKSAIVLNKDDNLLVCGRCERDGSSLEVHVYNDKTKDFYVHHDIPLSNTPLCIQWMDFDTGNESIKHCDKGNFVAVGNMNSVIEIWDLDVLNTIDPAFVLGIPLDKQNDVKSLTGHCHTDAIMDLAWNSLSRHILASSSADCTVALWDLCKGCQSNTFLSHREKVQAIDWRPNDTNFLLTGACDGRIIMFDARSCVPSGDNLKWKLKGEVERVAWNTDDNKYFTVSTESGSIFYYDIRHPRKSLYHWRSHDQAIPTLLFTSNILYSASSDGLFKAWDIGMESSDLILEKELKMGMIHCFHLNPDVPGLFAIGGERGGIRLWNSKTHFEGEASNGLGENNLKEKVNKPKQTSSKFTHFANTKMTKTKRSTKNKLGKATKQRHRNKPDRVKLLEQLK